MGHWLGSVGILNHGVNFNIDSAKMYSPAIFETYFSYQQKYIVAATDCYMYFYLIVLSPLMLSSCYELSCFNTYIFTYIFSLLNVIVPT